MFEEKIKNFPPEVQNMFTQLDGIVCSVAPAAEKRIWAGLPSYYVGEAFVRLIPFKGHINIEASSLESYKAELNGYKFTPKNMLQICVGQSIPADILKKVFAEALLGSAK